MYKMPDSKCSN